MPLSRRSRRSRRPLYASSTVSIIVAVSFMAHRHRHRDGSSADSGCRIRLRPPPSALRPWSSGVEMTRRTVFPRCTSEIVALALSVLVVTGSAVGGFVAPASAADIGGASTEAGPAARPPPDAPSSYGPDCRQHANAVARADELMAGTLELVPARAHAPPTEPARGSENPFGDVNWHVPVPQPAVRVGSLRGIADTYWRWRLPRSAACF